jgi:hypothetical protein
MRYRGWIVGLLIGLTVCASADEKLKDIACRSVHLRYPGAPATAFYNEIVVEQSAPGTYFSVCVWDKGYFGIQELGKGKKLVLFSVWDSDSNDPNAVPTERRTLKLHQDPAVRIGRFGGEGSGGQAFFDLDWQMGTTYRFLVTAQPTGDRTAYAGFLYRPETQMWTHLITFSTITGGKLLRGYSSFVEDFQRNRVSLTQPRSACFGNTWLQVDGRWQAVPEATFTADRNPATNINCDRKNDRWLLATGGMTTNTGTALTGTCKLPADYKPTAPSDLPTPPALPK